MIGNILRMIMVFFLSILFSTPSEIVVIFFQLCFHRNELKILSEKEWRVEICKKDGRYKEVITNCYLVKNAVILLGGRRTRKVEREAKEAAAAREGEEGEE